MRCRLRTAASVFLLFGFSVASRSQTSVALHTQTTGPVISKNIYGHFAEHLGHCIYDGIYVGDSNKIIHNTERMLDHRLSALVKLKVPVLRWPGGCFADTWHWKERVGPITLYPVMINKWWGGVTEDNSV